MEPEHIIDEQATIEGANIEKIYTECILWFENLDATIMEQNKPVSIRAVHKNIKNRYDMEKPINWGKIIEIRFFQYNSDTIVRVKMVPSKGMWKVYPVERARYYWASLLLDLYKHLGVEGSHDTLQRLYPKSEFKTAINLRILMFIIGLLIIMVVELSNISFEREIIWDISWRYVRWIWFLLILIGGYETYWVIYKERKKMKRLYPDE